MSSVQFLIGKTLGKYKVLEHIGHGGMSEVYKGQHEQLDRMVAVKVLHPFLADEEGFVVRFKREARIVATLRQPNIVQVFDFDYNAELGIYYMVMEYIDGPTLKILLNNGSLPVEEVARIGIAIAEALDYAHQRGMVHRDVKPANIMFIPGEQPVLTDFGIAKMLSMSELTASGAMVGTPAYMAPEVGIGKVGTSASDIYSLGVVLYQAVSGRLPFESDSPMGIVMQHINDSPPPLSRFVPSIPESFEAIILRAMEKQPEARFERAIDMASALRQVIGLDAGDVVPSPQADASVVATTSPPMATRAPSAAADFDDDDERLLRSWALPAEETPPIRTPTYFPDAKSGEDKGEKSPVKDRRIAVRRVIRSLWLLLAIVVIGGGVWSGIRGEIPPAVQRLLALANLSLWPDAPTEAVLPTATLSPVSDAAVTSAPSPVPVTVTPTSPPRTATPTTSATDCTPRFKVSNISIEPDDMVAPGSDFIAYVNLINNGECQWPQTLRLVFESGERMTEMSFIQITALAPDESIQLVLPLLAPEDVGLYESNWVVQQADERVIGIPIRIQVEVADVPTPTPLPNDSNGTTAPIPPLTLEAPVILEWHEDTTLGRWYGNAVIQATGGVGNYRYFWGEIGADTELPRGEFHVEGRVCGSIPVALWVVAGNEAVSWEGVIDYPAPEKCQ